MEKYIVYIIQLAAILFAVVVAFQNAPTVNRFERDGATNAEMAQLHRYNWWLKVVFCFVCSMRGSGWLEMLEYGLLAAGWIYLLFDPVLNLRRKPVRRWDYIGSNDADGRFWIGLFNGSAGKWKAVILSALLIAGNFLIKIF